MKIKLAFIALLSLACPLFLGAQRGIQSAIITPAPVSGALTWSFIQENRNDACTGGANRNCAVTMSSASTAGDTIIAVIGVLTNTTLSSVAEETFVHCPTCHIATGSNDVDAAYILSSAGSHSTYTCVVSADPGDFYSCRILEYRKSGGTATFDTSNTAPNSSCSSCPGATLTLTGTTDVIVQGLMVDNSVSAITGTYTNPTDVTGGLGTAGAINISSGTAPTWTQSPAGLPAGFGIAIKLN